MQAQHKPDFKPSSMNKLLLILMVCFVSLIVLLVSTGKQNVIALENEKLLVIQDAKVEVTTLKLQNSYFKPRTVYGRIESLKQANVGFELTGLLTSILVQEGQYVTKGQPLAELDLARLLAKQNELESALKSAKADAKLADLSAKRFSDLVSKRLEPQQRLDESIANLDATNARVSEAKARLKSLNVELEKSLLMAPFDGQIIAQHVDEGTVVNAGQGIFTVLETGSLEARFGLPEQTAYGLTPGQLIEVRSNNLILPATVKSIASQREFATRTITVVMTIDLPLGTNTVQIVSGDLVSLSIDIPIKAVGAWVPLDSLASAVRGLWAIYVIDAENKVEKRLVTVEYTNDAFAFIRGAISDGDKVVVSGVHRLAPSQYVKNISEVLIQHNSISNVEYQEPLKRTHLSSHNHIDDTTQSKQVDVR